MVRHSKPKRSKTPSTYRAATKSQPLTPAALEATLAAAVQAHYDNRHKEANQLYQKVIKGAPENATARSGLGMLAHRQGRTDVALRNLERAVRSEPTNAGFQMNLGAVREAADDLQGAAASYQQAINLTPDYRDPYYNLANVHLRQARPESAIAVLDQCLARNGRDFHALAYKAHALIDANRTSEAAYLLDHPALVRRYSFNDVPGYSSLEAFGTALANQVSGHPSLVRDAMSTVNGTHTAELLADHSGPLFDFEPHIHKAIRWYIDQLPDDTQHPMRVWQPRLWKLTSWGVVMGKGGHERSHIHPNGWLSGVMYAQLPALIDEPGRDHEGWLRFGQPTAELAVRSAPQLLDYQPRYGEIILFPSYFYHATVPLRSNVRRICVSFDVEPL